MHRETDLKECLSSHPQIGSFRRTMYKTLAEEVQEAEVQHLDPTAIIQKSVKKR